MGRHDGHRCSRAREAGRTLSGATEVSCHSELFLRSSATARGIKKTLPDSFWSMPGLGNLVLRRKNGNFKFGVHLTIQGGIPQCPNHFIDTAGTRRTGSGTATQRGDRVRTGAGAFDFRANAVSVANRFLPTSVRRAFNSNRFEIRTRSSQSSSQLSIESRFPHDVQPSLNCVGGIFF